MKKTMKKALALLFVLCLMLSLVACGESGNGGGTTPEPSESGEGSSSFDESDTFKVVVLAALNDDYGVKAKFVLDHMLEEQNAAGGVLGRKMELEWIDAGADQQAYINAVQKAVTTEGADAILGYFFGDWCIAASDIVSDAKIPTINLACNKIQLNMNDYYFINRAVTTGINDSWAEMCIDAGMTNPVLIFQNIDTGVATMNQFKEVYAKNGLEISDDNVIWFDIANTTDYTPLVIQAINKAGTNGLILNGTSGTDGQSLMDLIYQYEYEYPVSAVSSMMTDYISDIIGPEACEGVFGIAEYSPDLETPGNQNFLKKLDGWGWDLGAIDWAVTVYYDCFNIFVKAAETGGDTTKEAVYEGLNNLPKMEGAMTDYEGHIDHSFAISAYKSVFQPDGTVKLENPVDVVHSPLDR